MMWTQHMSSFVRINHKEIKTMVYRLCAAMKLEEQKDDVLHYVLRYFLLYNLSYKKEYVGEKGLATKLSTYIYSCVVKIILKYKKKDVPIGFGSKFERCSLKEVKVELDMKEDVILDMRKFFSFIKERIQNKSVPKSALKLMRLLIQGHTVKDAAKEMGVSTVSGSQTRSILRREFAIFNQRNELCVT